MRDNLGTVTDMVKLILLKHPEARNSDNILYLYVLKEKGKQKDIKLENMSVISFFTKIKELGVPSIETVGRCRRKIVESYPQLAGNDTVEGYRRVNEETFKEFAKGYVS